jgi:hypothetical protein
MGNNIETSEVRLFATFCIVSNNSLQREKTFSKQPNVLFISQNVRMSDKIINFVAKLIEIWL